MLVLVDIEELVLDVLMLIDVELLVEIDELVLEVEILLDVLEVEVVVAASDNRTPTAAKVRRIATVLFSIEPTSIPATPASVQAEPVSGSVVRTQVLATGGVEWLKASESLLVDPERILIRLADVVPTSSLMVAIPLMAIGV